MVAEDGPGRRKTAITLLLLTVYQICSSSGKCSLLNCQQKNMLIDIFMVTALLGKAYCAAFTANYPGTVVLQSGVSKQEPRCCVTNCHDVS